VSNFYQFLEFIRARSVQQSFQPAHNEEINEDQQQILSILNIKTNIQHKVSTTKRGRQLNDSGGSISSAPKQHKPNNNTSMQREDAVTTIIIATTEFNSF